MQRVPCLPGKIPLGQQSPDVSELLEGVRPP